MLAGRASNHASSLPAPSLHAGYSASQSKSHVLAGVQDAYWSDDEAEDADCPLCLEEMDISDLNFKPCVCGYQICRFCWHHIKENLNGRCPACRREYTEEGVQFKAVNPEDHKRLMQAKKQRERERKELETLGRKHLANVRVVQRNVVYVTGMGSRYAKEELIPTLRSNEYFGQYGKISKIIVTKRTAPGSSSSVVGLYITYHRREDATRCITLVDGAPPPGSGSEVMRASYGTTKYCMAFLRGVSCSDHSCMNLHEWGDEKDCFTKEDLTTLKHSIKDSESRTKTSAKSETEGALPRGASWASQKPTGVATAVTASTSASNTRRDRDKERDRDREVRRTTATTTRGARSEARSSTSTVTARPREERKASSTKTPSASRPSTPALSTVPARITTPGTETGTTKATRKKEPAPEPVSEPAPASPAVPTAVPVEPIPALKSPVVPKETPNVDTPPIVAASPVVTPAAPPGLPVAPPGLPAAPPSLPAAPPSLPAAPPGLPAIPPGLPAVPPGLSAVPPGLSLPPGLSVPKALVEPITPQISSSSSYTMSTQARALLDDVKARREQPAPVAQAAPFPDLDRTLQVLSAGSGEAGGFAFSLDTGLAEELGGPAGADGAAGSDIPDLSDLPELPDYAVESDLPFAGSFMAAFPGIKPSSYVGNGFVGVPPGLAMGAGMEFQHAPNRSIYDPRPPIPERQSTAGSNYTGSFNPFGDSSESLSQPSQPSYQSQPSPMLGDEDRKTSRFGFARGRQGSATPSVASTSSPLQALAQPDLSGLSAANAPTPFYSTHATNSPAMSSWSARPEYAVPPGQGQGQGQGRGTVGISRTASPFAHASQVSSGPQPFAPQPSRHLYDHGVTEAQLRDLMRSSTTPAPGRSMVSEQQRSNPSPFSGALHGHPHQQHQQHQQLQQHQPHTQHSHHQQHPQFHDPAIMSAGFAPPGLNVNSNGNEQQQQQGQAFGHNNHGMRHSAYNGANMNPTVNVNVNPGNSAMAFGPPPGLPYRGAASSPAMASHHGPMGMGSNMGMNMQGGLGSGSGPSLDSAHASTTTSPVTTSPPPIDISNFPILATTSAPSAERPGATSPLPIPAQVDEPTTDTTNTATATAAILQGDSKQAKEARKAAKKAAAAERAVERAKAAQERAAARAAEKTRLAAEKAEEKEKERAAKAMKEQEEKQRLEQEKTEKAKERAERAAKAEQEKAEREVAEQARLMKEQAEALRTQEKTEKATQLVQAKKAVAEKMAAGSVQSEAQVVSKGKDSPTASAPAQVPLLSKMPKKSRPVAKPIRIPKDDEVVHDTTSTLPSATTVDTPALPSVRISTSLEAIPSEAGPYSAGSTYSDRASLEELLDQIDMIQPWMNLLDHPFFDISKINPAAKMPLEYGPLVHALSALSVGGGSFANNMPSGSIDNAVSSFQQLLETLTQTISDLLRLLPRTTWDDSSSFDGVLRDMLKGDDFLDEGGEDGSSGRDDEVAALTLALERRARWMEVQLSKLEELHRDINTAAVRAVLSFNDRGWDKHGFLPRIGNSLARFDSLALVQEADGASRTMSADELEQKLTVANEAVAFAETELKESMEKMQGLRMLDDGF